MGIDVGGRPPFHAAILLVDQQGTVGYVGVGRLSRQSEWRTVWRFRGQIDTPLAAWLRSLTARPMEVVIVGSVGMGRRTAVAVVKLVAGWFPGAAVDRVRVGRCRPTGRVTQAGLQRWPSRGHAAAALGISRWGVLKRVRSGSLLNLT
jgi:hypothetical protein